MIGSALVGEYVPANKNNFTQGREGRSIQKITLHHMAARWSAQRLGESFQNPERFGSSHYGIGFEGEIGQYVGEEDTAWTDANWESNLVSVTIECANSAFGAPWPVSEKTVDSLVRLVADIAKRNKLGPLVKGVNFTWHQMYAATACPGETLLGRVDEIISRANVSLSEEEETLPMKIRYQAYASAWLPEVSGYDTEDDLFGYAGNLGTPISGVYAALNGGDVYYKAHQKGGEWLPEVKNREDWAGNLGFPIDGFMIRSPEANLRYRVHTAESGWLPEVSGYSEMDSLYGYGGNFGQSIDGIMIRVLNPAPDFSPEKEAPSLEEPLPEEEKPPAESPFLEEILPEKDTSEENLPPLEENLPVEEALPEKENPLEEKRNFLIRILVFLREWIDRFLSRLG